MKTCKVKWTNNAHATASALNTFVFKLTAQIISLSYRYTIVNDALKITETTSTELRKFQLTMQSMKSNRDGWTFQKGTTEFITGLSNGIRQRDPFSNIFMQSLVRIRPYNQVYQ